MPEVPPSHLVISDLLKRAPELKNEPGWEYFREGISVRWLYQEPNNGPAAALLNYQPGAAVPRHEHQGYEHILVLDGSQSDELGRYPAGTLVINRPGSSHPVISQEGCVVLIIWERGIKFL